MTYRKQRNADIRPPHRPVVLIADDEPALLLVLERYLTRAGFRVLSASTIEIALQLLDEWSISAVVVDLRFGSADGMTLVEAVHRWHHGLSVVAFTGHPEGCDQARAAGVPCVEKGNAGSFGELVGLLRSALGLGQNG
jgi:CheY-like chemotaxis protein